MPTKYSHPAFALILGILAMLAGAVPAEPPTSAAIYAKPGPFAVETFDFGWHDAARQRDVPVKIYLPQGAGPFPVIIFSHGLGGSREGYGYLGRHWASHGFASVHLTHPGSDTAILSQGMAAMNRAAADPRNIINRPRDVSFAIDQITSATRGAGPLHGKLNPERIGIAGHSFGGYTTLAAAGQTFVGPRGREFKLGDPRLKAAIAMSAPARPAAPDRLDRMYGSIRIPCFLMTGTLDDSPIGDTRAADRRIPFDHLNGADTYLLTLAGGDHMVFSGRLQGSRKRPTDDRFQSLILMGSTAFWEVYLKGNAAAKDWLAGGDYAKTVGGDGAFESKPHRRKP